MIYAAGEEYEERFTIKCGVAASSVIRSGKEDLVITDTAVAKDGSGNNVEKTIRKGLLVQSKKSGTAAEGTTFSLGDMAGTFDIDFRVFSDKVFAGYTGWDYPGTLFSDDINPFQDLKRVTFKFTDKATGKVVEVNVDGSAPWYRSTPTVHVKTGSMTEGKGIYYETAATYVNQGFYGNYGTYMYASSFTNVVGDYSTTSRFEFDPFEMKVYAYSRCAYDQNTNERISTYEVRKDLVLDLKNAEHVGEENVLSSFGAYSVDVIFADVTPNDYTDEYIAAAYDRYAKMVIYSLNGQSFDGTDGIIEDNAPATIFVENKNGKIGEKTDFDIHYYDVIDGYKGYTGKVKAYAPGADAFAELTATDGKLEFTPELLGTYRFVIENLADTAGNVATKEFTLTVKDDIAPVLEFVGGLSGKYDLTDGADAKPTVSENDVKITNKNDLKTYSVTVTITAPDGNVVENPDFAAAGKYTVTYTVTDNFGNAATLTREITVGDFSKLIVEVKEGLNGKAGEEIDISLKSVSDYSSYTVTVVVKKGDEVVGESLAFTPSVCGNYVAYYTVTDAFDNVTTATANIYVTDEIDPVIALVEDLLNKYDLQSGTVAPTISENDVVIGNRNSNKTYTITFTVTLPDLTTSDVVPDFRVKGQYIVTYTVTDNFGNSASIERTIESGDYTKPTVVVDETKEAKVGDTLTFEPISVSDYSTYTVTVVVKKDGQVVSEGKEFKCEEAGEYEVVYTVADADGNTEIAYTKLTVAEADDDSSCSGNLGGDACAMVLLAVAAVVLKRKAKASC